MLKEIYKAVRTHFIKQRLLDGRVVWNDVWWTLLAYGNTVHLREDLGEKTLSTMDSIASDIISRFRAYEVQIGSAGNTTDEQRVMIMRTIKSDRD
jgi:hypothetical protein